MSIRFKFRSSVNFDSVEIDGRSSISVRDLRAKIMAQKNLKICQDFDLVISDSTTGQEYDDENFLVPSGSSVIIKRVPVGREAPSALALGNAVDNSGIKQVDPVHTVGSDPSRNVDVENFDDFGIDLYPAMGASQLDSDDDVDKINDIGVEIVDKANPRSSDPSILRQQNLEASDLSVAFQRAVPFGARGDPLSTDLKLKIEEHKRLDDALDASSPAMPKFELPSELRCSLCNTIFKEAMMIPCCQHSFCEKCIRLVLIEKARCPKCYSTKCSARDLLPNVSLRQAIEHFLESQILISGSDNALPKYAPDGESGIQAKEVSCAVSIRQREPLLPHSPSGTGKGSNQVMNESVYESVMRNKGLAGNGSRTIHLDASAKYPKSASSLQNMKQMRNVEQDGETCPLNYRGIPEGLDSVAEFQGENQPLMTSRTLMQKEEASSAMKRKGSWVNPIDGVGSFAVTPKYRKGDRTCYKCGSPDHLIRDCPAASGQYPMLQTAYGPPYWHGTSFPPRPYGNMYAAPGVMPYGPTMFPVSPVGVPSYMSPMYGGMSVPCGLMRMGGFVPPMASGAEYPVSQAELMELQDSEQRHKHLYEHPKREIRDPNLDEGGYYCEPHLSHDCGPKMDGENNESYSEHNDIPRSWKKHSRYKHPDDGTHPVISRKEKGSLTSVARRDPRAYHPDLSSSEMEDKSDNSDWHSKERHKNHHVTSKKNRDIRDNHDVRDHYDSDSSRRSHHKSQKGMATDRKRVEADSKRHRRRHHNQSESGLELSSSGDRKRKVKEKESSHSSRHSKHKVKSTDDQLTHARWEMVDGFDEESREEYYHHRKRKKNH